ncbi:uncharacterized protein LOC135495533 isoform X2 [Lineus longissimus]|uniref:uncharacterized protein LOC135495533 isoform X2 n=1 Tax=Lineus longissimus TaxID=88925 RepID=UPI00315DF2A2
MKMFSRNRNRKKKDMNHSSEANRDVLNNSKLSHHPEILAMGELPPNSNAGSLNQQNDAISKYILALAEKHKTAKKEPQTWRTFLHNFAKNSTFHGVRHVFDSSSFLARRILWGLLILVSMGFLLNQVIDRILYFSRNPVTVKVEVNFNKTLRFPAVLLCNQNSFKITEAVRLGYKSMLDDLYSKDEVDRPEVLKKHNFSHVQLDELFLSTAHKKEDMIVSCSWKYRNCDEPLNCSWNDKNCSHMNFTQVLTDHGVCYVFNGKGQKTLFVSESGASSALRVVLNVEQYENMIGPYDGAGVKILLYDRRDIPSIEDHGQGIATGTHTYVGTQVVMVRKECCQFEESSAMKRLPPPTGNCTENTRKLDYYSYYSEHACDVICWTKFYAKQCHCILPHMPQIEDFPKCTLEQYFSCGTTAKRRMFEESFNKDRECNCKSSCDSVIYQPNFSYLSTSNFDIEKIFKFVNTEKLLRRFIGARDSSSATESDIFEVDKTILERLSENADKISHLLKVEIPNNLNATENEMEAARTSLSNIYTKILYSYEFQHYVVRKNFYRFVVAQNERMWSDVSQSYGTFFFKLRRSAQILRNMEDNEENAAKRFAVHNQALAEIEAKRYMTQASLKMARRCYKSYLLGRPGFRYPYMGVLNESVNDMIVPRALLKAALDRWSSEDDPIKEFSDNLVNLTAVYDSSAALLGSLYNNTGNETQLELYRKILGLWPPFGNCMRAHNGLRSHLLDDVYIYPVQEMEKRLENLKTVYSRLSDVLISTTQHVETMHKSLQRIKGSVWGNISAVFEKTRNYCKHKTPGKTELSKIVASSRTRDNTKFIKAFFEDTGSRCRQIYDNWQKLSTLEDDLFTLVRSDDDMLTFRKFYIPELAGNDTTFSAIGSRVKEAMANVLKFRQLAESGDSEFQESFRVLWTHFTNYLARNEINAQFYEENFLTMDIFFRELSYEMIEQQEAYNLIALLSDIGGSMGLFIGASILSIFEILDLFTFSFIIKKKTNKKLHVGTPGGVAV